MSTGLLEHRAQETESLDSVFERCDHGLITIESGEPEIELLSDDGSLPVVDNDLVLRRVRVLYPDGRYHVIRELMRADSAARLVAEWNRTHDDKAEAIDYLQAFREARVVEVMAARRGL